MKKFIIILISLICFTSNTWAQTDRAQLLAALERFENDYNLIDGTDYRRVTMSAGAWTDLIKKVKEVSLALDDETRTSEYATLKDELTAQLDSTDISLRLFKSYNGMIAGTKALSIAAGDTYSSTTYTSNDEKERAAIAALNTAFLEYAYENKTDIDVAGFLGNNLDFNTPQGQRLTTDEAFSIYDIDGWEEQYQNLDGWCFIENSNTDHNGQLYLRVNWTDKAVVLKALKQTMLPVGKYTLSLSWNCDLANMKNLSAYVVGKTSRAINRTVTTARVLTYNFEVKNEPKSFDLIFGFQKKNSGNTPAQILVDDISLTYLYDESLTDIDAIPTTNEKDVYYDLGGRSVSRPMHPGVYIHQGRKLIIR